MASTLPDKPLRLAIARLARLGDEDVRGVLSHLSASEVQAVQALLAEAGAAAKTDWLQLPAWVLDRVGARLPGYRAPRGLRSVQALWSSGSSGLTPHTAQVFEQLVRREMRRPQGPGADGDTA
jgi:hypothetical protein